MATPSISNNDIANRITCRVNIQHDKGTAVLVAPTSSDLLYLITAKHCLLGKNFDQEISKSEIEISVFGDREEFHSFKLQEQDEILFPSKESIDAAVIVLRQKHICVPNVAILNVQFMSQECFFRGYPEAYGSLKGITIRPVRYTDNNVVTTSIPLATIDSDPLYNCQGFSGSGVFCDVNGQLFLLGLVYELEEPFQRFKVCDLSFLNDLLAAHNLSTLQFEILPVNESIAEDIQKLVSKSNLVLDGIINCFGNDLVLERGTVDNELDRKFSGNRLLIFKGEAGAGKSAYAKSTIVRLREANYAILAFKADAFARGSIEEALPYLDNGLDQVLLQLGQQQQVVILIDSLEKLLEVETYEALKEFLRICKQLMFCPNRIGTKPA